MSRDARPVPPSRLRLGIVCDQLEIGGQELGMLELLRRLDRRQFSPHVYATTPGPLLRELGRLGVPVLLASDRRRRGTAWTSADARIKVEFRRRLARALRDDRIDVCLVYAVASAVAAAREAGVPAIVERVDGPKLVGWVPDKSSCQRLICQSQAIARLIAAQRQRFRCEGVQIDVVRNGIDLGRFDPDRYDRARCRAALGIPKGTFVAGTVARLVPVKNLGHLLDAAQGFLGAKSPSHPLQVLVAGPDGGELATLRQRARDLGIARHVRFLGPRADVPRVLRALDVFVLPSFQEGVPFALLEAMAMGLPVIASQVESIVETVRDNGYLVGPLDPWRTTLALRELAAHEPLRRALGAQGRRLAARHDLDRTAREYARVLRAAHREGLRGATFRRRIAIVTGHPARSSRAHPLSVNRLFAPLVRRGVDTYLLDLRDAPRAPARWPPGRRHSSRSGEPWPARLAVLEWVQPDAILTDCPAIVRGVRRRFAGEEIVFAPDVADDCAIDRHVLRLADRVVLRTADALQAFRRRWPASAWKMCRWPDDAAPAQAVVDVLSTPRPVAPIVR